MSPRTDKVEEGKQNRNTKNTQKKHTSLVVASCATTVTGQPHFILDCHYSSPPLPPPLSLRLFCSTDRNAARRRPKTTAWYVVPGSDRPSPSPHQRPPGISQVSTVHVHVSIRLGRASDGRVLPGSNVVTRFWERRNLGKNMCEGMFIVDTFTEYSTAGNYPIQRKHEYALDGILR